MPILPEEITIRRGLPIVSLERAIVDLAEVGTDHDVASAFDRALLLKLLDHRRLDEAMARAHGRHGLKILLPAIARLSEHGETFLSITEWRVRDALLDAGLPRPKMNERVHRPQGRTCRPDLLWPEARLIAEVDGPQHGMPYQRELDRQRDAWLTAAGYRILRFPVAEVDDHFDTVLARIVAELELHRTHVIPPASTPRKQVG